ncbi:hypothetical protein [Pseudogulbenkiania ferrooxidans]|uniref:hypothetical protein n=1 Tax=Pseudogulbenkiania ferrooxidans TaxID=549169 RepID=UPI001267926D|nr:hypothetical protein [Pseudogulbenkiania ferrooxidans]
MLLAGVLLAQQQFALALLAAVFLRVGDQLALTALRRLALAAAGAFLLALAFLLLPPLELPFGLALRLQLRLGQAAHAIPLD